MKTLIIAVMSLIAALAPGPAAAQVRVEVTSDQVKTLIGRKSTGLSFAGLHLGMTRPQAEAVLAASKTFKAVADEDDFFPDRLYVYARSNPKDTLMTLTWEEKRRDGKGEPRTAAGLQDITLYAAFRPYLAPGFDKLLTMEAVKRDSAFMKAFLGAPSRVKEITDPPSIGGKKYTTFYYDAIGVELTEFLDKAQGDHVVALFR